MSKEITIHLSDPRALWRPGDTISGEVHFDCTKQVDVEGIYIRLTGESYAEFVESSGTGNDTTTTRRRSMVQLFYFNSILFQGPFSLSPTSMSWPFQFRIPLDCSSAMGDIFQEDPMFNTWNEQPLPLAFASRAHSKRCHIEYSLDAILDTSGMFSRNAGFKIPLQIVAPKSGLIPQLQQRTIELPNPLNFRSLRLLPEYSDRKLTLKEKMKSVFKPETLPNVSFTAKLELPETVWLQGVICPVLSLDYNPDKSSVKMPEITLISFSLAIEYFVTIRVKRYGRDYVRNWKESRPVAEFNGRAAISTDRLEISRLFHESITIQPYHSAAFQTYNITVQCGWKAKYTIECGKERLDTKVAIGCIILQP